MYACVTSVMFYACCVVVKSWIIQKSHSINYRYSIQYSVLYFYYYLLIAKMRAAAGRRACGTDFEKKWRWVLARRVIWVPVLVRSSVPAPCVIACAKRASGVGVRRNGVCHMYFRLRAKHLWVRELTRIAAGRSECPLRLDLTELLWEKRCCTIELNFSIVQRCVSKNHRTSVAPQFHAKDWVSTSYCFVHNEISAQLDPGVIDRAACRFYLFTPFGKIGRAAAGCDCSFGPVDKTCPVERVAMSLKWHWATALLTMWIGPAGIKELLSTLWKRNIGGEFER